MPSFASSAGSKTINPQEIEIQVPANNIDNGPASPRSWRQSQFLDSRKQTANSLDMDDYFAGPRDMSKHSKLPFFLRLHGSVLPKMLLPLLVVTLWSTAITCISTWVYPLVVSNLLLTVLGIVVGTAISFRTSSAYERYAEGRKYWSSLLLAGQNLSRTIWIHTKEREGDLGRDDLLAKLSAMNLIVAYAVALKHKLRFEPGIDYPDLKPLVEYLDTFAKAAEADIPKATEPGKMKAMGEYLGVSFAESNPRKRIKRAKKPLGNLPLEILNHLAAYIDGLIAENTLSVGLYQNQAITSIVNMNDVMVGVERVLQTPLPIAYTITFSQITWVYVMMLPFQLWASLGWITIPGCIFAAYIILGIAAIGKEIENPFGNDVNDLPLEAYCEELANDIDIITAMPAPEPKRFMRNMRNMPMWPLSEKGWDSWGHRSKYDIREALMTKTRADMTVRRSFNPAGDTGAEDEKHHGALQVNNDV